MNTTVQAAGQPCLIVKSSPLSKVRKSITAGLVAIAVFGTTPAFAKDPCKTALCMWGLFTGTNDSSCNQAIQDHFDIVVYKKKKRIDWNSTAKQRLGFTNSCPGSDQGINKKINDKFGKSSG